MLAILSLGTAAAAATDVWTAAANAGGPWVMGENATGHLCQGCAVVMEAVQDRIIEWDKTMTPGKELRLGTWLQKECKKPHWAKQYTSKILSACNQMHTNNGLITGPFVHKDRNGEIEKPSPRNLYERTQMACQGLQLCQPAEGPPLGYFMGTINNCRLCRAVVGDWYDVLGRKRAWSEYASRGHVSSVLDSACSGLPSRFRWTKVTEKMQEYCDEMLEDYEDDIISAMASLKSGKTEKEVEQQVCGKLAGACKAEELDDDGSTIWRSPHSDRKSVAPEKPPPLNTPGPPDEGDGEESDEEGSDEEGSDEEGSDEEGSDEAPDGGPASPSTHHVEEL
jgi:hypothetical protein